MKNVQGLPSIPDYFKDYVDPNIDLNDSPQIQCPFHGEKSGKSFSYSRELKIWRCFGQCHKGGDVIALHQLNMRMKTRDEAKMSLLSLYGIKLEKHLKFDVEKYEVDEKEVYRRRVYNRALALAKNPDDWIELDYILSKVPYDVKELEVFCSSRGYRIESEEVGYEMEK